MDEYDDHDYCDRCDKHTTECWCFSCAPPDSDDEVCRTPDECTGQATDTGGHALVTDPLFIDPSPADREQRRDIVAHQSRPLTARPVRNLAEQLSNGSCLAP